MKEAQKQSDIHWARTKDAATTRRKGEEGREDDTTGRETHTDDTTGKGTHTEQHHRQRDPRQKKQTQTRRPLKKRSPDADQAQCTEQTLQVTFVHSGLAYTRGSCVRTPPIR